MAATWWRSSRTEICRHGVRLDRWDRWDRWGVADGAVGWFGSGLAACAGATRGLERTWDSGYYPQFQKRRR